MGQFLEVEGKGRWRDPERIGNHGRGQSLRHKQPEDCQAGLLRQGGKGSDDRFIVHVSMIVEVSLIR